MIPGIDGAQVVKELRLRLGDAAPHVALITASQVPETVLSELGVVAYLQKPFSIEDVVALVQKFAPRK